MRRVIIVVVIFFLMYILQYLQIEVDTAFNPKTMATTGFILLAAYTIGEIAYLFGVPRITGYIFSGLIFGPHFHRLVNDLFEVDITWLSLFSTGVVDNLKLVNTLALGLIALSAGGELKVAILKRVWRSVTSLALIKSSLIIVLVAGSFFLANDFGLVPFLAGADVQVVFFASIIVGILGIGTSPATTIAIVNETESEGPLTEITLGLAVVKDVMIIILLAVFVNMAMVAMTPETSFDFNFIASIGLKLIFSILAGGLVGVVIWAYLKWVNRELMIFLICLIFLAGWLIEMLHLEALLVFIVAGFLVENFSEQGHGLIKSIEKVSLPVYVIFFAIVSADLDLFALKTFLVLALVLVTVRLIAIYLGSFLATRVASTEPEIRRNAWLGFVAQAGVTIGVAKLMVEPNLGDLGESLFLVTLAAVTVNLIVGPALFKIALANVGETRAKREQLEDIESQLDEALSQVQNIDREALEELIERAESGDPNSIESLKKMGLLKE